MVRSLHVSALLGKVYWADAKGNVMREPKQDVTEAFLGCVMQFFSNPDKGLVHDAEGNEWKVTITQTKNVTAQSQQPLVTDNISREKDDRVTQENSVLTTAIKLCRSHALFKPDKCVDLVLRTTKPWADVENNTIPLKQDDPVKAPDVVLKKDLPDPKEIVSQIDSLTNKIEQKSGSSYDEILKVASEFNFIREKVELLKNGLGPGHEHEFDEIMEKTYKFNHILVKLLNVK
jgi:hypothetical protein